MRTPPESRRYWEDRLMSEYLEAMDAFRIARNRVRDLQRLARDCSGSTDGIMALEQANAIYTSAHVRYRDALFAFNDVILNGKIPEDR
jgi:hypothetical protein